MVGVAFALVVGGFAVADGIPTTTPLTYSGVLQNSTGTPIATPQSMQLTLWDDATANASVNQKCVTPTQSITPDSEGRFQIVLDQACFEAVRSNPNLWVQVQVGATVLPRSKLGAVPYAVESGRSTRTVVSYMGRSLTAFGIYCGATPSTTGAVSASGGSLTGYRAVKFLCEQACGSPTAHICTIPEVIASAQLGAPAPASLGWISGPTGDLGSPSGAGSGRFFRDCATFTTTSTSHAGQVWNPSAGGGGDVRACSDSFPMLCCN